MTPSAAAAQDDRRRLRVRVRGAVQGVGFRPFIHGLAARHALGGFVLNDGEGVLAEVEGAGLDDFLGALRREKPSLARIDAVEVTALPSQGQHAFAIRDSASQGRARTCVVPDAATCADCLRDLFDPASRFYLYPFVTCTQCGPRFTMLDRLPYDRPNTSMAAFAMCAACERDYRDPVDRRFHAEAIACPACGPRLSHGVDEIAAALRRGQIVAVKGLGGFHLFCDASSEIAVTRLRRRKGRPDKPLAVMVANLAALDELAAPTPAERELLAHAAGPIVLVSVLASGSAALATSVAPGMHRVGVMLASTPVHHLLCRALGFALVATSANADGEPMLIDDAEARRTLADIADLVVTHDRAILVRADDSVMAVVDGAPTFIRRARGFVPEPIDLGVDGPCVLAAGGHLKATLCITRGREAFVSQHLGDLRGPAAARFHEATARRWADMLGVSPELVVCDLHPDYRSTRFAEASGMPVLQVQHHAAHIAAVAAEHRLGDTVLGVSLDGHGLGDEGGAWGGELMRLDGRHWRRVGHLALLPVPGGDLAAREPWRMGVAVLWTLGRGSEAAARFPGIALAGRLGDVPAATWQMSTTSSLGRLFDAAAALLGVCLHQSYEGQAAMALEALVRMRVGVPRCLAGGYRISDHVLDFAPLLAAIAAPGMDARDGAELFHGTVIAGVSEWVAQAAIEHGQTDVALGGGCLVNRVLAEGLTSALRARQLRPWLPRAVPANDGGLSLGQAALARAWLKAGQVPATRS